MWLDRIVPARAASSRSLEFDRYCVCLMKISEMKRNLFFFCCLGKPLEASVSNSTMFNYLGMCIYRLELYDR